MGKIEMFRKALAIPEVIQNVELTGILKDLLSLFVSKRNRVYFVAERILKLDDEMLLLTRSL